MKTQLHHYNPNPKINSAPPHPQTKKVDSQRGPWGHRPHNAKHSRALWVTFSLAGPSSRNDRTTGTHHTCNSNQLSSQCVDHKNDRTKGTHHACNSNPLSSWCVDHRNDRTTGTCPFLPFKPTVAMDRSS